MKTPPEIIAYMKTIDIPLYVFAEENHLKSSNLYLYRDGLACPRFDTLQALVNAVGKPLAITIMPEVK